MTHPDDYRVFYWAPDMSFCGFASNNIYQKSGLAEASNTNARLYATTVIPGNERAMPSIIKDIKKTL